MDRRNFVTTLPVLAAGLAATSPLMAISNDARKMEQEALLAEMKAYFAPHLAVIGEDKATFIKQLSTPVSTPEFVDGKLTYATVSGEQVYLYRRNDQFRVTIGGC